MSSLRVLIVDDEPHARTKLRRFLSDIPEVQVLGEAGDAAEALQLCAALQPELLFVDIQMPGMSGLELAASLPEAVRCIFVTAFDQFAVRAFELNAVDYLLKPFTRERLAAAVARVRKSNHEGSAPRQQLLSALHTLQPVPRHWLVPHRGKLLKVPLSEVQWLQAADNYLELHVPPACYLDRITLAAFLAHPAAAGFARVHRSYAVNTEHVQSVVALAKGDAELTLRCGMTVRLSRHFRSQFLP